jgi:acetyl-CoA carboxylase carboxyl transferase subunit alpha
VPEPEAGAHADYDGAAALLAVSLEDALAAARVLRPEERVLRRYEKFRRMGRYTE